MTEEKERSPETDNRGYSEYLKRVLSGPTFAEVSRLTFGPLRDIRIFYQNEYNDFAQLLNRGSSSE